MTSKEIAEMIQRAKEAEALFDDLRDDERPVYSTLQKVGSALDELIQFAERPVYEPVKTEDIDCGKYFIRKDSMRANLIKFVTVDPDGRLIVYERSAEVGTVEDYVLRGHAFFRIPEVPKLGVAE